MVDRHIHDVFFGGKSLADFGVHVSGDGTYNSPEKDFETVEVPGRNGDLHIFNERFKNVDLTYKAFIIGDEWISGKPHEDFHLQMQALRAWLMHLNGYQRLEDTYHPDEYRMALFKGPIETEAVFLQAGEFDLTFNCMPQRFLKSGEKTYTYSKGSASTKTFELDNPTYFDAKPFLKVYGTGDITINNTIIRILTGYSNSYMNIDCDIQDAYFGELNCNSYIVLSDGEFFKLSPGVNNITLSKGISKIELIPRWWTL